MEVMLLVPAGPVSAAHEYLFKPHACCSQALSAVAGVWKDSEETNKKGAIQIQVSLSFQ